MLAKTSRNTRCCLTGTCALEHIAGIVETVLLHSDEIGVAGSWLCQGNFGVAWFRRHFCMPLVRAEPFGVLNFNAHRGPKSASVAHATHEGDSIFFETLARTAPIPKTTTSEFAFDVRGKNGDASRQTLDNDGEGATMRFASSEVPEHP